MERIRQVILGATHLANFLAGVGATLSIILLAQEVRAEGTSSQTGAVIDFNADVIQGEKKKTDIFIQMGSHQQSMDSVLYDRGQFNEFLEIDAPTRPDYFQLKQNTPKKKNPGK